MNKGPLAELDLDEHIGHTAQKAEYADALATRKILPAFVTDFLADAATVRTVNTVIVTTDTSAKEATRHEETCQEKLLTGLRQIQAAARQEYQQTNPIKLEAYLVGERIDASRQRLDQSAATLLKLAAEERPGGLDTEFLDRIADCHADSKQANFSQGDQQTDLQKERLKQNAQLASLKQRRQQIQFAAENLWPHRDPENAPIRRDFRLPVKRPYIG